MIIYKATNIVTGEVYIGETRQTLVQRKAQHFYEAFKRGLTDKFHTAIREYGKENFTFEPIAKSNSFTNLAKKERDLIIKFESIDKGYNTQVRKDIMLKRGGK